jgi:hypothetical protein
VDWLTFFATLAGHIAWPLAFVTAVLVLRHPLGHLIRSLQLFRYRGFEAHFGREIERIEGKLEQGILPPPSAEEPPADQLETVAEVAPKAAVLAAWKLLEGELRKVAREAGQTNSRLSGGMLIRALEMHGELDKSFAGLLTDMWHLRNDATHVDTMPSEQARRYVDVAKNVAARLRMVGR